MQEVLIGEGNNSDLSGLSNFSKESKGNYYLDYKYSNSLEADLYRSEEHTSELQSRLHLVCRLLLEKKKRKKRKKKRKNKKKKRKKEEEKKSDNPKLP